MTEERLSQYSYKHVRNNVAIDVRFGMDAEPPFSATIVYRDHNTNRSDKINLVHTKFLHEILDAIHERRKDRLDVYSRALSEKDAEDLWLEKWKSAKCLYEGMPNRSALVLLRGLRKPVRHDIRMGPDGRVKTEKQSARLMEAGLVDVVEPVPGRRRTSVMTNLRGWEVLNHWAKTKGTFGTYLAAYCPPNWYEEYTARAVLERLSPRDMVA